MMTYANDIDAAYAASEYGTACGGVFREPRYAERIGEPDRHAVWLAMQETKNDPPPPYIERIKRRVAGKLCGDEWR